MTTPTTPTTEENLARFFEACMRAAWKGYDMEGGELQTLALELGLIVCEPFDPAKHAIDAEYEFDVMPGEDWYVFIPAVSALLHTV